MLITGTCVQESLAASALAQDYRDYCWSTAGVHPHHASEWNTQTAEQLRALAGRPEVVAIGECGLDFNRNFSTPDQQEAAFSAQLALAADLQMPVFLHCREAHSRFVALLSPWLDKLPAAVVHCFTGTAEELTDCLSLGLSVGITGWVCDERRGLALRALLPQIPADRLLLETDAPLSAATGFTAQTGISPQRTGFFAPPCPTGRRLAAGRSSVAGADNRSKCAPHLPIDLSKPLSGTKHARYVYIFSNWRLSRLCVTCLLIRLSSSIERASPSGSV
ncbi:Deoxyribonuclease TatD [Serratia odorifera]|uniref:Deoxyribonuclease TatD n=1 Tax=Serratia odorifera TaxID=618 RepID=A0A3S4HJX0_SEROD|nr:Deoxyribonuclease TatD [Serratia odorifera]